MYTGSGELVCDTCGRTAEMEREAEEVEHEKAVRGGLLDRLFLSRLSPTGKRAYWIGQVGAVVVLFAVVMSGTSSGAIRDSDMSVFLFGGAIAIILVWGISCLVLWPRKRVS